MLTENPAHYVNGRDMFSGYPDGFEQIQLGMGCFWGAERILWKLDGVYVTCLLYTSPSPRDKRQSRMPSSA